MKTKRLELLLIALTVLAMGAGVAAGLLAARLPASSTTIAPPGSTDMTPLVAELGLSPDQRDQMRTIWEGVRDDIRASFDRAQRLQQQRDQAILGLLTDDQKARFETISQDFANRYNDLNRDRDQAFAAAVEKTKALLNPDQQQKYDQLLRSRGAVPGSSAGQNQ